MSQLGIYIGITYPIFQGWLFYTPDSNRIGRIYVGIDVTWNEIIPLHESAYFQPLEAILNVMSPPKSKNVTDFEYLIGLTHIGIGIYVSFADPRGPILILVYVDDLLIGTTTITQREDVIKYLKSRANCTDMGPVTTFIGLQINYDREKGTVRLSMANSIALMLQKLKLTDIRPRVRPGDQVAIQSEYGPSVVDMTTSPSQILPAAEITKYRRHLPVSILTSYRRHLPVSTFTSYRRHLPVFILTSYRRHLPVSTFTSYRRHLPVSVFSYDDDYSVFIQSKFIPILTTMLIPFSFNRSSFRFLRR